MRVAMLGGTFDPVHLGHLIGAQAAAEQLELDRVLFVPAANPPHKLNVPITPAEHRVAMLERALAGSERFSLYLDEITRSGSSYTIDTVRRYRQSELQEGDDLFFIVGADNLAELHTWKNWEALCREVKFVVLAREGFQPDNESLEKKLGSAQILWVKMPLIGISATGIRNSCASGSSIRYLVPDSVAEYIESRGLYRK